MSNKRTIKALEELVKTEYMAMSALDQALEEVDDNKLRKQYRKWRDSHAKQAEALNERIEELGGQSVEYEVGSGKAQAKLWGKITGGGQDSSVEGMRIGAERGIKRYIDHIDEVEDPEALSIIRRNLESKQDEMRWYDDQASKERSKKVDTRVEVAKEKMEESDVAEAEGKKKRGGLPFPLLLLLGAAGAAAFFLLRRNDESDYDDFDEDTFQYEGEETGTESGFTSAGSYTAGGTEQ